jgi:hypothetical protein
MAKSSTLSPIDDLTYDVITVLQNKAQALAAYDKYIGDAQSEDDSDLLDLFVEMRKQDEENVLALKEALAHRLEDDLGYDDEDEVDEEGDTEDYDDDDHQLEQVDAAPAMPPANATPTPPRRGESSQRQR